MDPKKLAFLQANIRRARGRHDGKQITLTAQQAYQIGERQGWLCNITGRRLEFTRGGSYYGGKWANPLSCSIDRLNNSRGYTRGNVHLVTWAVNLARGNCDLDSFKQALGFE